MSESQEGNGGDPANACVQHQPNNTSKTSKHSGRNDLLWVLFDPPGRLEEGSHVMYAVSSEIRSDWLDNKCESKDIFFPLTVANKFALDIFLQEMEGPWGYSGLPFFERIKCTQVDGEGEIKWKISDIGELSLWADDDDGEIRRVWVQRHVIKGDHPSQSESSKKRKIAGNS